MEQPSPSQLLLDLSSIQKQIISSHSLDALAQMSAIQFVDGKQLEQMAGHAFHKGRLAMCQELQNYDQGILESRPTQDEEST